MITNTGKEIIGKYLLGQAPAYASYIAIGCGPKPITAATSTPYGDYSAKESLDFEMFRVPISSRGFVSESTTSTKIVLTAELPTEERYEITEVGIYSAGSDPLAGAYDSKTIFSFTTAENWKIDGITTISSTSAPLDQGGTANVIGITSPIFQTNADNSIFFKVNRGEKYERCRFFSNVIMLGGASSTISATGSPVIYVPSATSKIQIEGISADFTRNAPTDELRLAFSVINKNATSGTNPDSAKLIVEFSNAAGTQYARFQVNAANTSGTVANTSGVFTAAYSATTSTYYCNFNTNRYYVVSKRLQDLVTTSGFTWDSVSVARVYGAVEVGGATTSGYYIGLDAMRLENTQTTNPLYGLTGYSVIRNSTASSIIKDPNTSTYIEFRFGVGVS